MKSTEFRTESLSNALRYIEALMREGAHIRIESSECFSEFENPDFVDYTFTIDACWPNSTGENEYFYFANTSRDMKKEENNELSYFMENYYGTD